MSEDLAVALLYEGSEQTDLALQLFDNEGRVVVLDVFGNLMQVGKEARTDTFIVPLRKYPSATQITVRRITGPVRLRGMVLYPVVGQAEADQQTLEELAKLLGDPLAPDSTLAKRIVGIAHRQDVPLQWPIQTRIGAGTPDAGLGGLPTMLPRPGLVAHWSFDDCTAADTSGNGHHGDVRGAPRCVAGVRGRAFALDGRKDWIKVEHAPALDLKQSLTVSAWINYRSIADGYGSEILWYGDLQPAHDPYTIHLLPGGVYQFRIDTDGGHRSLVVDCAERLQPDRWYHVAATMERGTGKEKVLKSFVNGQLIHVETVQGEIDYDTAGMWTAIGAVDQGGWQLFHGMIDEVSVYNRALTKAEIRALYDSLRLPPR